MRCQYCGKRLPLFRKLKDGEFCSAAHREQFLAQSDQMALAALTESRERTLRSRISAKPPLAPPPEPAPKDGTFCDRFLSTPMTALPLGQLAGVALSRASVLPDLYMPERFTTSHIGSAGSTPLGGLQPDSMGKLLPADVTLSALSQLGAPAAAGAVLEMPVRRLDYPKPARLPLGARFEGEKIQLEIGTLMLTRPAAWIGSRPALSVIPTGLAPDDLRFRRNLEATAMADQVALRLPTAHAPAAALMSSQALPQFAVSCFIWFARHPWQLTTAPLASAGLEPLPNDPVALADLCIVEGPPVVRFPALIPTFSTMPVRPRAALVVAAPARFAQAMSACLSGEKTATAVARPKFAAPGTILPSASFGIAGQLLDLIQPAALAPPRRLPWRFEAQNVLSVRTLAVRPIASELSMEIPVRKTVAASPKRATQLIRLTPVFRAARLEAAPATESVTFHLEPKVIQPRLRARPDPAKRAASKDNRRNHADAAMSSIKIPVLRRFWAHAPADIRWVALVIPLVFLLAWYSWTPDGKALNKQAETADLAVDTSGVQTVMASFRSRISNRAAVELSEDFRAGLGEWQGARENWAENWSYDQAGFVRPGSLAIFTPTIALHDYNFEFLGQIENHALTWVYRAKDVRNYYQGKLVITRSGPVPEVSLVRSVVKDGREYNRKQIVLTMNLRSDTLYRVRVDVNGSDFTTSVLGQVVDTFTDASHPQGGVGFAGGRGETGRVRWVEVSHQYDTLGRLCAMLVPYGVGGTTASAKTVGQ